MTTVVASISSQTTDVMVTQERHRIMELRIDKNATPERAREEWARWLESGEFQQGHDSLTQAAHPFSAEGESYTTHCCLGVAAEMGCELGILEREPTNTDMMYKNADPTKSSEVHSGSLPKVMAQFLGINGLGDLQHNVQHYDEWGHVQQDASSLAGLNDTLLWDFKTIATVVRIGAFVKDEPTDESPE